MDSYIDLREVKAEDLKQIDIDMVNINLEPPIEEPARQYYYMAKCRRYVKAESERLGRNLFAYTQTFGWSGAVSKKDSEKMQKESG